MPVQITVTPRPPAPQPPFQGKPSFVQRLLEFTIALAPDAQGGQPASFAGTGGSDTVTISGARASVRIEKNGAPAGSQAQVTIYGLAPNVMNQLQTLGQSFDQIRRNQITVSAGDASGLSPVFSGTIMNAYADYNQAPNVPMIFDCLASGIDSVVPALASSFTGQTDVATIMAGFARQMGLGFENNGVTVQLASPYFSGNIKEQKNKCAAAANINAEEIDGVLAIWPKGGSRTSLSGTGQLPLISPDTGMIGYPTFWMQNGLIVRMLFNPQIAFGGTVQVQSSILQGTGNPNLQKGTFVVWKLDLALDSLVPNGKWEGMAHCYAQGFASPIPQEATS